MNADAYNNYLKKIKKTKLVTRKQAAEALGVSVDTVSRYIARGVLQTVNFEGSELILRDGMDKFFCLLDSHEAGDILGVSARTVLRRMEKDIPFIYYKKRKCCKLQDLMRYAETHLK